MEFGEGFNLGSGFSSYNDPDMNNDDDDDDDDDELGACSDSSSSVGSISESSDDDDVASSYKEPLKSRDISQPVVHVRGGISKFYSGKSKSFTSLSDAVSSASVKEFAKPETLYKKQSNLLARKIPNSKQFNPGRHFEKFGPSDYGNINRLDDPCSSSASPPFCLPPLHPQRKVIQHPGSLVPPPPQKCSPWRSFSVSDLQSMVHNA